MGGFRRFVLFVFSVAGILCLAALALPWYGLFDEQFLVLWDYAWYPVVVEACLAMTAAWLAFNLLRALFSRRRRKSLSVMKIDGGKVSVTRNAVASQATHVVNESGIGRAKGVEVRAGKRGPIDLTVKLVPHESVDVTKEAPVLHGLLAKGVGAMVGERLGAIDIEFLGPQRESSLAADDEADEADEFDDTAASAEPNADEAYSDEASVEEHGETTDADEEAAESAETSLDVDPSGDITIPMRSEKEE